MTQNNNLRIKALSRAFLFAFLWTWGMHTALDCAAQPLDQLCASAGKKEGCLPSQAKKSEKSRNKNPGQDNLCPKGWANSRKGNCFIQTTAFSKDLQSAYVHPGGWIVDTRCFQRKDFTRTQLLEALTSAWKKMDPAIPVGNGGCLSEFNPEWGRELMSAVWDARMHVECPDLVIQETHCAEYDKRETGGFIALLNMAKCMPEEKTGFSGIIFHESLHAAGADSYSTEQHEEAWNMDQYMFVKDRVYAAQTTCFWGTDPKRRMQVHQQQCRETVSYHATKPRYDLCQGLEATYTNTPAHVIIY